MSSHRITQRAKRAVISFAALCLAALAGAATDARTTSASASTRPNILFILTDDMGYGDVTCNGPGAGIRTPNIDALAAQGTRFTQYYVAAPVCSPSRAALITGQFPAKVRINTFLQTRAGNQACDQDDWLDPKYETLPRILKKAGYATAHIGKWHLGGGRDVTTAPKFREYGYDESAGTYESPEPDPKLGRHLAPWDQRLEPGQVPRYARTAYMVDRTLDFIQRHKDGPWFVNLWPDDVHTPHRSSPEMVAKYAGKGKLKDNADANFWGVLDEYDRQIGRLMDGLKKLGVDQNTIVIFTSDNGPAPKLEGRTNGMRGMKLSLYEGGIREPFIVRWPGHVPAGRVDNNSVIAAVDMLPTFATITGANVPDEAKPRLNGVDISSAFAGKDMPTRKVALYWEYGRTSHHGRARRPGDKSPNLAVREGDHKLLVNDNGNNCELYDIPVDANESKNLVGQPGEESVADTLTTSVLNWRRAMPHRGMKP